MGRQEAGAAAEVRPGIAERLSRMIAIPTVSATLEADGPGAFERFEELLAELYPLVHERLEREKLDDLGILYRWRGRASDRPVVLMAHYDVVPAEAEQTWTHPPFAGRVVDGVVWGRGAMDDKGELCTLLDAVENLLASGFVPAQDVYLSLGGNEETHGDAARIVADTLHARGVRPWLVLDEGGAVVDSPLSFVPGQAAMVGVVEKGFLTVLLEARADGGHAATPTVPTATTRIARAVRRIEARPFRARLPRSGRAMLAAFVPHARGAARLLLKAMVGHPWLGARVLAAVGGEPGALVRTTVATTMLSGGSAANVLPAHASATLNIRVAVGETTGSVLRRLRRIIADPRVSLTVQEASESTPEAPTSGPQFALVRRAIRASYPEAMVAPYVMYATADARFFARYTPATYRFAPLALTAGQRAAMHGVDENVSVDALVRGERFYRALLGGLPA